MRTIPAIAALAFTIACPVFSAAPESLADILKRMDRAADSFKDLSADVRWVQHTAVIDEDSAQTGTMLLKRNKRDTQMLVNFKEPDRKTVQLHDRKLDIYYPKQNTVQEYDIGQHRDLLDQFMLLGFGTSGKELAAVYDMKVLGAETINGEPTTRIELVPKSADVRRNLLKVEMWIPVSEAYPIQQKFYLPGGDYKLVTYTNVKMNPGLSDSDLKMKLPKDAKREYPQK